MKLILILVFSSQIIYAQNVYEDIKLTDEKVEYRTSFVQEALSICFALLDKQSKYYYNINDTTSTYYNKVQKHFADFKTHTFIKELQTKYDKDDDIYYDYIYNSVNYTFDENGLVFKKKLGKKPKFPNKNALTNFIYESSFIEFFKENRDFYIENLRSLKKLADVNDMIKFLDVHFSSRYENYIIMISPLMSGYNFTGRNIRDRLAVMWVPDHSNFSKIKYTDSQIAGLYTGMIFTEIDHNYINPKSNEFRKKLNKALGRKNREKWVNEQIVDGYRSGYEVFNEYVTHAIYLIYIEEMIHDKEDLNIIINNSIKLNKDYRGFIRYPEFYEYVKNLYYSNSSKPIESYFENIVEWFNK